jgi:hypothetical protein
LINGADRKRVRSNYMDDFIKETFKEYAKSTMEKAIKENLGSLEEEDCLVKIIAENET